MCVTERARIAGEIQKRRAILDNVCKRPSLMSEDSNLSYKPRSRHPHEVDEYVLQAMLHENSVQFS